MCATIWTTIIGKITAERKSPNFEGNITHVLRMLIGFGYQNCCYRVQRKDATRNIHGLVSMHGECVCSQTYDRWTQGTYSVYQFWQVCSYLVDGVAVQRRLRCHSMGPVETWAEMRILMILKFLLVSYRWDLFTLSWTTSHRMSIWWRFPSTSKISLGKFKGY